MSDRAVLSYRLTILPGRYAACRLDPSDTIPSWASGGVFTSMTQTSDELSIICAEALVPSSVRCERAFVVLKVEGPLPFEQVGVLASLAMPLAEAGVSIISVGTFDTDYVLVRAGDLHVALAALAGAGHRVDGAPTSPRA